MSSVTIELPEAVVRRLATGRIDPPTVLTEACREWVDANPEPVPAPPAPPDNAPKIGSRWTWMGRTYRVLALEVELNRWIVVYEWTAGDPNDARMWHGAKVSVEAWNAANRVPFVDPTPPRVGSLDGLLVCAADQLQPGDVLRGGRVVRRVKRRDNAVKLVLEGGWAHFVDLESLVVLDAAAGSDSDG